MRNGFSKFLFIALGFLFGCLASAVLIGFGVKARVDYLSYLYGLDGSLAEKDGPLVAKILQEAESAQQFDDLQKACDLIITQISNWSELENKSKGYEILTSCALSKNNLEQAVVYAEKMVEYDPMTGRDHGGWRLYTLANVYDHSGDFKQALATYQKLLNLNLPNNVMDMTNVHQRIEQLNKIVQTPTP